MANNDFEKAVLDNACGVREDAQVPEDIQKILKSNQNLVEMFSKMSENDKFFAAVILACASLIDPKEKGCEQCTEHIGHADAARKLMVDAPAVDAAPVVHGRWGEYELHPLAPSLNGYPCTVCGQREQRETNFCPNCGAKMDGDSPEETEDEVCEACAITYSWERGSANVLGETNDADE